MRNITAKLQASDDFYTHTGFIESRQWDDKRGKDIVLCDISPSEYKPFYLGANIIDGVLNGSRYNVGRAIWEAGEESMEWFTQSRIRDFKVIGLCAFMYYQIFGIPAFLADNKIQPLAKNRTSKDPLIILGGQLYYLFNGYDKFVDVACIGEGEEFIIELMDIVDSHTGTREELLHKLSKIPGAYVPVIHGSDLEPVITKRIVPQDRMRELARDNSFCKSKHRNNVIEVARGCRYHCGFCSLTKRMFPFRTMDIDTVKGKINGLPEGATVYPFAPDEASYPHRHELAEWCEIRGLKMFRYNFRLDTIKPEDVITQDQSKQIVLGIDGVSQRIINIIGKQIKLDKLRNEIAPLAFKSGCKELKLNYVFNYDFETDEDYEELYQLWKQLVEIRIAAGSECVIRISPTPFLPEAFVPLQFRQVRPNITPRFMDVYNRIKHEFFDVRGVKPLLMIQGIQNEKNWRCSIIMHRVKELSDLVYYCYKNGHRKSGYDDKLLDLVTSWLKSKGKAFPDMINSLDHTQPTWFEKLDWSGGQLDARKFVRRQYDEIVRRLTNDISQ